MEFKYVPENCPLTNTWTPWPADCTLIVGFCPPRRNDSDGLISTLACKPEIVRSQLLKLRKLKGYLTRNVINLKFHIQKCKVSPSEENQQYIQIETVLTKNEIAFRLFHYKLKKKRFCALETAINSVQPKEFLGLLLCKQLNCSLLNKWTNFMFVKLQFEYLGVVLLNAKQCSSSPCYVP